MGKQIDNYYRVKAIQLYLEGISISDISDMIGVSHDAIQVWLAPLKGLLKPIRLPKQSLEFSISKEGIRLEVEDEDLYTSGVVVNQEGSQVWGVKRDARKVEKQKVKRVEKIKYKKYNDAQELNDTNYSPTEVAPEKKKDKKKNVESKNKSKK
jgi:transposase